MMSQVDVTVDIYDKC